MNKFRIGDGVFDMVECGLTDIFIVVQVNDNDTVMVDYGDCGIHEVNVEDLELAYEADYIPGFDDGESC